MQRRLAAEQLSSFYTDSATRDQVRAFLSLAPVMRLRKGPVVVDVGGGQGHFAGELQATIGGRARVLDTDPIALAEAERRGVDTILGDALAPPFGGDEDVACFNLILHHLIGQTEARTRALQVQALKAWRGNAQFVFVTEYVYESGLSARMSYWITRSKFLSALAAAIARLTPTLQANTFGVGVRFRPAGEWHQLFREAGFKVADYRPGREERVRWPRRLLFITSIRRDTFLLQQ